MFCSSAFFLLSFLVEEDSPPVQLHLWKAIIALVAVLAYALLWHMPHYGQVSPYNYGVSLSHNAQGTRDIAPVEFCGEMRNNLPLCHVVWRNPSERYG